MINLGVLSGVDGRDVDQGLDSAFPGYPGDPGRSVDVDLLERKVFRLKLPPNQVDDHVRVFHGLPQRVLVHQMVGGEEHLTQVPTDFEPQHVVVISPVGNYHLEKSSTKIRKFFLGV